MTTSIAIVLAILVIAFGLFVSGRVKPDLIALLVLIALVFSQVIDPSEAFAGFSSFAVITIAGLMVIGDGLERTGVVKWVARTLESIIHKRYSRLLFLNTAIPGLLSGFVNIVAAASFFIPVILRLCQQMKVPQSKILLPMACTALIGANLTLIGASHNLVVDSLLVRATGEGFGFFEFTVVGAALLGAALIYIFVVGQHLLPGDSEVPKPRKVPETPNLVDVYALHERLFEVWVADEVGNDLPITPLDISNYGLSLIAVARESEELLKPDVEEPLHDGDMLLIQGREEVVKALCEERPDLSFMGAPHAQEEYPISTGELAEAVVPPRSPLIGKTLGEAEFISEFGMTPIAYYRDDEPHRTGASTVELKEGDSILFYGPREKLREFEPEKDLLIYFKPGEPQVSSKLKRKAPFAACILLAVVVPAALGWMPIAATAVAGAVAMVLGGIVPLKRFYEVIDWRTLILIGGMYPLGVALNSTGAADLVGETLIASLGDFGPEAVFAGIILLCMILTQPIHNAAVAIIMTPIAINAATMMGSDPRAFCVGVIVACSATFLMPYGHPAPFLVQEPGGYKSGDYIKFGIGLNVIAFAIILGLVPVFWPL